MKRIISLFVCMVLAFAAHAQVTIDDIPLEKEFSYVFHSDNAIGKKMVNAKSWIANNFGDYKAVMQYEDDENHRIIIKGQTPATVEYNEGNGKTIAWTSSQKYLFTMTFDFKDDRYRIKFGDIVIMSGITFGHEVPEPDMEVIWDRHFSLSTQSTEDEIAKLSAEKDDLLNQLQGKLKKKDVERINARLAKIDESIADKEDYIHNRAPKALAKDILDFKTTFMSLFNSAAKAIDEDDDF